MRHLKNLIILICLLIRCIVYCVYLVFSFISDLLAAAFNFERPFILLVENIKKAFHYGEDIFY